MRAEIQMRSGHSVWAKTRQASDVIDIQGLLKQYWDSDEHEFTVPSQSRPPISRSISDRAAVAVSFGKYDGRLELEFSAHVRAFAIPRLSQFLMLSRPTLFARRSITSKIY